MNKDQLIHSIQKIQQSYYLFDEDNKYGDSDFYWVSNRGIYESGRLYYDSISLITAEEVEKAHKVFEGLNKKQVKHIIENEIEYNGLASWADIYHYGNIYNANCKPNMVRIEDEDTGYVQLKERDFAYFIGVGNGQFTEWGSMDLETIQIWYDRIMNGELITSALNTNKVFNLLKKHTNVEDLIR